MAFASGGLTCLQLKRKRESRQGTACSERAVGASLDSVRWGGGAQPAGRVFGAVPWYLTGTEPAEAVCMRSFIHSLSGPGSHACYMQTPQEVLASQR